MALRVAMVGCGGQGQGHHAPVWWDIDYVSFVAVCDLMKEKADAVAKKYNAKAYYDLDEMLAEEKLDILDVVTKPKDHCSCTLAALKAGVHVFCETSLATSTEEAKLMVETAEKQNRILGHTNNYRFAPHHQMLKQMISSGELGNPCYINSTGHIATFHHRTDLMRYFGGEITEVYSCPAKSGDKLLSQNVSVKFESGATGTLMGSNYISWQHPFMRIDYLGTKGRVITNDLVGGLRKYDMDKREWTVWEPTAFEERDFRITSRRSIEAFAESIERGTEPPATGINGVRYHQLVDAMRKSAERNKPVRPY